VAWSRLPIGDALFVGYGRLFDTRSSSKVPGKILRSKFGEENDGNLDKTVENLMLPSSS
jgi:hypothetical protein